jgi:hypothetical protein
MKRGLIFTVLLFFSVGLAYTQEIVSPNETRRILLPAKQGDLWGYISSQGEEVIPFTYSKADPFNEQEVARVEMDGVFMIINKQNEVLFRGAYKNFLHLSGNYYKYQCDTNWGIVRIGDSYTSECVFREPFALGKDLAVFKVQKGEKYGLLDSSLQPIMDYNFDAIWRDSGIIIGDIGGYYGAFDKKGRTLTAVQWDSILPLSDRHLVAFDTANAFLIDGIIGRKTILDKGTYQRLNDKYFAQIDEGTTKVTSLVDVSFKTLKTEIIKALEKRDDYFVYFKDDWFGLYHYDRGLILDPADKYQEIRGRDSLILARKDSKFNFYTDQGKQLSKDGFDRCLNFENGLAFANSDSRWGILKRSGELLIPYDYRSITILEGEIRAITQEGGLILYEYLDGKITDKMEFGSIYKLNLKGYDNTTRSVSAPSIKVSTRWFQKTRWGLKDSVGNELIKPIFQNVQRSKLSPYVFVTIPRQKGDLYPFRMRRRGTADRQGLVNEQTGKILAFPYHSMISRRDVENPNQDLVRVRSYAGYYGVISKTSRKNRVMWKTTYIGPFNNGLAPIYIRGYMTLKKPSKDAQPIGYLYQILEDMGYSTGWGLFEKSKHKAMDKVYVTGGKWNYLQQNGRLLIRDGVHFTLTDTAISKTRKMSYADIFRNGIARIKVGSKWGLIDTSGEVVVAPEFDNLRPVVRKDSVYYISSRYTPQYSCFTAEGHIVNSHPVNSMGDFNDGVAWIRRGKKYGVMNQQGEVIESNLNLGRHGVFGSGYAPVKLGRSWTFVDKDLIEIDTDRKYYRLGSFHDSRAFAKAKFLDEKTPRYGFIDDSFNWVLTPRYIRAYDFHNGFARVKDMKGRLSYVDKTGRVIHSGTFTKALDFNYGLAVVYRGSRSGILNEQGKWIVPLKQHRVFVNDEIIMAQKGQKLMVYNSLGKRIAKHRNITRVYHVEEGLVRVRQKTKIGYMNKEGVWQISPRYSSATNFENGSALAGNGTRKWIINQNGDTMNRRLFRTKQGFSNGYFIQNTPGSGGTPRYYYVNTTGNNQFGTFYDVAKPFQHGKAIVRTGGYYGVIDTNGLFIVPPIFSSIAKTTENLVVALNDYNYGLFDQSGNQVLAPIYESVRFLPEDLIMITKHEAPSYMDFQLNWIWRSPELRISQN